MKMHVPIAALVILLFCTPARSAVLVNVDFDDSINGAQGSNTQTYSGVSPSNVGGTNAVWNSWVFIHNAGNTSPSTSPALKDSNNNATPYTLTFTGGTANYRAWDYLAPGATALSRDYIFSVDNFTFTLSGFDPEEQYLVTVHFFGLNSTTQLTLGSQTLSSTRGSDPNRYNTFNPATVSGSSSLVGTVNTVGNKGFTGMQFEIELIVPEPTTLGLFCSGLLAFAFVRKMVAGPRA